MHLDCWNFHFPSFLFVDQAIFEIRRKNKNKKLKIGNFLHFTFIPFRRKRKSAGALSKIFTWCGLIHNKNWNRNINKFNIIATADKRFSSNKENLPYVGWCRFSKRPLYRLAPSKPLVVLHQIIVHSNTTLSGSRPSAFMHYHQTALWCFQLDSPF